MILTMSLIAGAALLLTLAITPPLRDLARRKNWLDIPRGRKRHPVPTPFVGGWVIFGVFWLGMAAALLALPEFAREFRPYLLPIFAAHLVVFVGSLIDDFTPLRPRFKFAIQITAALILWFGGLQINTFYVPFYGSIDLIWPLSIVATTLWMILIMNAMNFVDGMDGLACGLATLTAVGLLYTAVALNILVVKVMAVLVIAVTLGFLRYNFPKATTFMGDSGSQSLGFVFAVAAIYCPIKSYTVVAMFIPLLTLGVPLAELVLTIIRRLLTGKPITRGDFRQSFHMLQIRGVGKLKIVLTFWAVAATLQIFAFTLFLFDRRIVFSILVLFMLIVAGWFLLLSRKEER